MSVTGVQCPVLFLHTVDEIPGIDSSNQSLSLLYQFETYATTCTNLEPEILDLCWRYLVDSIVVHPRISTGSHPKSEEHPSKDSPSKK